MFALFFILWVMFNGRVTLEIVLFGLGISAIVFFFLCRYMDYGLKKEAGVYRNFFHGIGYVFLLVDEIFKANFYVLRLILSVKYEIEPVLIHFRTDLKSDAAKVVLANSITLTPGTITVDLKGDEYLVHCLDRELAKGIEESSFVKRLRKMETKRGK